MRAPRATGSSGREGVEIVASSSSQRKTITEAGQGLQQPEREHGQTEVAMDSPQRRFHGHFLSNGSRGHFGDRVQ